MLCRDFEVQINLYKVKEKASELQNGHDIHVTQSFEVFENIDMRSMHELFYSAGWVEVGQFVYLMFSFLSQKRA